MRLEPGEVPRLPLPAALVAPDGAPVAVTPEWAGTGPGTISFHTGYGHLLVAPDVPTPHLDVLMTGLVGELHAALRSMPGETARHARLLVAGLELVAGHPVAAGGGGTADEVAALVVAGVRARVQGLAVRVAEPLTRVIVPAPAAVALALVQLAVNAHEHERAPSVTIRVAAGPTFAIEWPGAGGAGGVRSHRHPLRRTGWGWGYVRMVADALGGVAVPPGPAGPGVVGACLGLGSARLALPVACVREGRVVRATEAWEQDPDMPAAGDPVNHALAGLVGRAERQPGRIAYADLYRARSGDGRTWAALAPESGASRATDVLRGLQHERALWSAPEPHATRIGALATLLDTALGGTPWPSPPPGLYRELLVSACAALDVPPPAPIDVLAAPEPRVVAFLLSRLGGELVQRGEEVYLRPRRSAADPLLRALRPGPDGSILLNSSPER